MIGFKSDEDVIRGGKAAKLQVDFGGANREAQILIAILKNQQMHVLMKKNQPPARDRRTPNGKTLEMWAA